ncbi:MAG: TraR/DksA C4-type zinc finger protein [Ignavibacteriales bacterium]|nr:TraR/DksA C4-type zinc finger protein [Ignavibacteriales bacterium]
MQARTSHAGEVSMAKKIAKKTTSSAKTIRAKASPAAKSMAMKAKPAPVKPPVARKGYNKTELTYFKKIILEKRKEILEELETLKASMMDVTTGEYATENSTYSLHMEQGTDTMEREKTFLFASREGKFLNYLDDALKRLEKGEYGFCLDCGTLIDKERLEAVPHAQLCINCKLKRGK